VNNVDEDETNHQDDVDKDEVPTTAMRMMAIGDV
jgi:hypothetical protein